MRFAIFRAGSPKTLQQAIQYFSDEQPASMPSPRCAGLMAAMPGNCEGDKGKKLITQTRSAGNVGTCRKQFSVKVGTIFEETRSL